MKRVTGLGGVFFKCKNPEHLRRWYREHLGIKSDQHGATFQWLDPGRPGTKGHTIWAPFPSKTRYFSPGRGSFMLNYRVKNLKALLAALRKERVRIVGKIEEYEYGKFGWIMDPEGNKVELWEPPRQPPPSKRRKKA